MKRFASFRLTLARAVLVMGAVTNPAWAQSNPYAKGPDPTSASVQAVGPFAVSSQTVSGWGTIFGSATVYSPNTPGKYAVVAVCPGFWANQSTMTAISMRLASHGFVVATIQPKNTYADQPASRANQLLAALTKVTSLTTGPVAGKMDTARLAVAGWSMGGGGAILAAAKTPGLKSGVAWAPWLGDATDKANVSALVVPVSFLGGELDPTAPPKDHVEVFYASATNAPYKMLGVIKGQNHDFVKDQVTEPASYTTIAWMKRFADNDTRYSQFIANEARFSKFAKVGTL